jgi:glucose uptake protein
MVVVHRYSLAVFLCIITMLCWGSWANTQKLAGKRWWPFQLFYWDYSIGVVLLTLILALTMGSIGVEGRPFTTDIMQSSLSSICFALLSGVVFNLANILLVSGIAIAGMAVAFPIAIGLALVIGVIANYMAHPIGHAGILFAGVGLVVIAIIVDAMAYWFRAQQQKTTFKGIVISVISGILMGYFYRFLVMGMSVDFSNPLVGKLTPYTAAFIFSLGLFFSNFIFNTVAMIKPFTGEPVSYRSYFKQGKIGLHFVGILGGIIWSIGLTFSLVAAGPAGYAISYGLGQGATMVAAFWGVFVWREFIDSSVFVKWLIALMFFFYAFGLVLIILARNH